MKITDVEALKELKKVRSEELWDRIDEISGE